MQPPIKNIIFDFGDVFINLDKDIIFRKMAEYGGTSELTPAMTELNDIYEVGRISSEEFVAGLRKLYPEATKDQVIDIWNGMLLDFPETRLKFLEQLAQEGQYRLFLLSNTNAMHIPYVEQHMGSDRFQRFKNSFEKFYLSHEIHLRKPDLEIYRFVLDENGLKAEETFFIDDTKANTDAASTLGIRCWNLQVGREDVVQLKSKL